MHSGNVRFRRMVEECLEEYSSTVTKMEKTFILGDIIAQVRMNSPDGGFVKKDPKDNRWYEVGDYLAREKTSQAFRDALFDQYKSSNTAKKLRKRGEKMKIMPRRAFSSTSLLDTKKIAGVDGHHFGGGGGTKPGGYSDPLLAKLRMSKSARSVLEFGENGAPRRGVGGAAGGLSHKANIMASCPNLTGNSFHAGAASTGNFGLGGVGGAESSRNFEWGSGASGGGGGGDSNKNFEWGSAKPASKPSASRKFSLDLFSSFTGGGATKQPQQQPAFMANMFAGQQQNSGQVPTSETEPESRNNSNNMASLQQQVQQQLQGVVGGDENDLLGMLSSAMTGLQGVSPNVVQSNDNSIESKLAQLRESTFEASGGGCNSNNNIGGLNINAMANAFAAAASSSAMNPPPNMNPNNDSNPIPNNLMSLDDIDSLDNLMTSIVEEKGPPEASTDVFDTLVDLVGDVKQGDPFEPDPLP